MLVVFGAGATVLNSIMSGKPKIGSQVEKIKSVERSKSPKTSMRQRKVKPSNELNKRIAPRIASREIPQRVGAAMRARRGNSNTFATNKSIESEAATDNKHKLADRYCQR